MTNRPRGTLYIGVTSDLPSRARQHRNGDLPGFTKTHGLKRLVYVERFDSMTEAIQREKTLKHYTRQWKCNLIERDNPHWDDLFYFDDPIVLMRGSPLCMTLGLAPKIQG